MIKLVISFLIFIFFTSCQFKNTNNISEIITEKKLTVKKELKNENKIIKDNKIKYFIGEPYFIEGVKYIPLEDYNYIKNGLATYYNKELHNTKTANNDLNKVTELLARHKTLPLPSIVKITNLENGLSLIVKINDRHDDNSSIIQVSRKVAQLLRFYKNEIAQVRIEILSDPSKQMKIVTESINDPNFEETIDSAPTEAVVISDLNEINLDQKEITSYSKQPIKLGVEDVTKTKLYLKVYGFKSYSEAKELIKILKVETKTTTEKEGDTYSILLGPIENNDANNLVSSFIDKGYKNTEIIIE